MKRGAAPARFESPDVIAQRLKDTIDREIEPEKMSKGKAKEVLEALRDLINGALEALTEEMKDED